MRKLDSCLSNMTFNHVADFLHQPVLTILPAAPEKTFPQAVKEFGKTREHWTEKCYICQQPGQILSFSLFCRAEAVINALFISVHTEGME